MGWDGIGWVGLGMDGTWVGVSGGCFSVRYLG